MNRQELSAKTKQAIVEIINSKDFITPIDIFVALQYLKEIDIEEWRNKKVPYLEKRITGNLGKTNHVLREIAKYAKDLHLKPSNTVYKSWGAGNKVTLRFSKSGDSNLERAYSTHYVKPQE